MIQIFDYLKTKDIILWFSSMKIIKDQFHDTIFTLFLDEIFFYSVHQIFLIIKKSNFAYLRIC